MCFTEGAFDFGARPIWHGLLVYCTRGVHVLSLTIDYRTETRPTRSSQGRRARCVRSRHRPSAESIHDKDAPAGELGRPLRKMRRWRWQQRGFANRPEARGRYSYLPIRDARKGGSVKKKRMEMGARCRGFDN